MCTLTTSRAHSKLGFHPVFTKQCRWMFSDKQISEDIGVFKLKPLKTPHEVNQVFQGPKLH